MKMFAVLILSLVVLCPLFAASVELPKNMVSRFADRVSVFDAKLPDNRFDKLRQFKLTIKLHASVTNSICIRLGRDGMFGAKDTLLAMEESMCELGIDCNEFVLRRNGFKERYAHTPTEAGTSRERIFTVRMRVSAENSADVRSVSFEEDSAPFVFEELPIVPCPDDLNPALWTDLRVLVRNGGVQSVAVQYLKDGALVIVR